MSGDYDPLRLIEALRFIAEALLIGALVYVFWLIIVT